MTATPAPRSQMTRADIARLLALMASWDQRTTGESDVEAWYLTAEHGRWNIDGAIRAVVSHYTHTKRRIMPADITEFLRSPGETGQRICEY